MQRITNWIERSTGLTADIQEKLFLSLLVLFAVWLTSYLFSRVLLKRQPDIRKRYKWRKITNYIITGIGLLFLANIWFESFQSVATFLGLLSAGLVLALKEPVLNMSGWLFIIWKHPFSIGDRIQLDEQYGDVIDIRLFHFSINEIKNWVDADQSTGRVIHIPNGLLFTKSLANYNYGFRYIWHEVPVKITFESDWKKAKIILHNIIQKHSEKLSETTEQQVRVQAQRYLIFYESLEPSIYTKVLDNGVQLTLRYLCDIKKRRSSENNIWEDVLSAFLMEPDIQFAYPTTRFFQKGSQKSGSDLNRSSNVDQ